LVELARNGKAPSASACREVEDMLTPGPMITEQLFDRFIAVLRLPPNTFKSLSNAQYTSISENIFGFHNHSMALSPLSVEAMSLTDSDRDML
jgi:predicted aconitase with swiveling domain